MMFNAQCELRQRRNARNLNCNEISLEPVPPRIVIPLEITFSSTEIRTLINLKGINSAQTIPQ
jgi:hypothetical protein